MKTIFTGLRNVFKFTMKIQYVEFGKIKLFCAQLYKLNI